MRRAAMLMIGVLCTVAGLLGVASGSLRYLDAFRTKDWPSTEGTIVTSEVVTGGDARKWFEPRISYQYEVQSKTHLAHSIWYQSGTTSKSVAEEVAFAHPVASTVRVHYDPTNPSRALLLPGASWGIALPILVSIVALFGGVVILFDMCPERYRKEDAA